MLQRPSKNAPSSIIKEGVSRSACTLPRAVISTRWTGGRIVIHVLSDGAPETGFEPVDADLQDAYFSTLKRAAA